MAKHNVFVELPLHEMGKTDAFFTVRSNGRKVGQITISKGAIEWYSYKAKKPIKLSWKQFDQAMKEYIKS